MAKPYTYKSDIVKPIPPIINSSQKYYRLEKQGQWSYQIIELVDGVETKIKAPNLLSIVEGQLIELMIKI